MQHDLIPTCYFPSMVLFLDDGNDFLLNVVLQLDERVAYRLFDMPIEALNFISNYRYEFGLFSRHCLSEYQEAQQHSNKTLQIDLAALHAEVYNPYRFSELSVLVVDIAARDMGGLAFCRRIENRMIKKILLINREDEACAKQALDEGSIDCYIYKNEFHLVDLIKKNIERLQWCYFLGMSAMVARLLPVELPVCLRDQAFEKFFTRFREKKGIIEYYLIDNAGGFLMLDEDAYANILIIKPEEDRQSSCFIGEKSYAYSYESHYPLFSLRQKKILSYHRYLEELDADELFVL